MDFDNDLEMQNNLLKKAIDGDIDSFEKLIVQYEKLIFNISYRMFGNIEDAKDASQESLLKIYRNIHKCVDIKHFKSWIYTVTNNTCIDEFRKRKGKYTSSIDEQIDLGEGSISKQLKSTEISPEDQYINKEFSQSIQQAIDKLSPDKKELIILRDINGLSYDELSEIINVPLGTIKSRLARARSNLKDIVLELKEQNIL